MPSGWASNMASAYIIATGKIVRRGDIEIKMALPPVPDTVPLDGELQRLLDEAADTDEYIDDIEDRNIWRRGQW